MTKVKKNKMKTHKGTKKVLNVRKSGTIALTHQGGLHNTGKQSAKRRGDSCFNELLNKFNISVEDYIKTHAEYYCNSPNVALCKKYNLKYSQVRYINKKLGLICEIKTNGKTNKKRVY